MMTMDIMVKMLNLMEEEDVDDDDDDDDNDDTIARWMGYWRGFFWILNIYTFSWIWSRAPPNMWSITD